MMALADSIACAKSSPKASRVLRALTVRACRVAAVTCTLPLALWPCREAVIVASPGAIADTRPVASTVATLGLLEDQAASGVTSCTAPPVKRPSAAKA